MVGTRGAASAVPTPSNSFASLNLFPSFFLSPAATTDGPPTSNPVEEEDEEDEEDGIDVDELDDEGDGDPEAPGNSVVPQKRNWEVGDSGESHVRGSSISSSPAGVSGMKQSSSTPQDPAQPPQKVRKTRGSKACVACRKVKARCIGSANPPCQRCIQAEQECVFTASRRGKRGPPKPISQNAPIDKASLQKLEATFDSAFGALTQPDIVASHAGAISNLIIPPTPASGGPPPGSDASPIISTSLAAGPHHPDQITPALGKDEDLGPRLHSLPDNTLNPLGLLAEASRRNAPHSMSFQTVLETSDVVGDQDPDSRVLEQKRLGLANKAYFHPNPLNILPLRGLIFNQRVPARILTTKLLSPEEVEDLFNIYFDSMNENYPLLCRELHTPTATTQRSPFLFSCICTVSSRFYTKRTDDLYRKCLRFTRDASAELLSKGYKSPEVVQGFLLLSHWNQPAQTYEQELTYQFSGLAIRMATDLNLQRQSTVTLPDNVSADARKRFDLEVMNRERVWLHCFVTDRTISTQMGKPSCIAKEDLIIRSAKRWFTRNGSQPTDIGLCAMVELHRVGRILNILHSDSFGSPEIPKNLDYAALTEMFLGLLDQWHDDWIQPEITTGSTLREFYYWYYRLFVLSFAIQHARQDPTSSLDLSGYCLSSCESVNEIINLSQALCDENRLKYATDATFTCLTYSAVFLLKLVSPTFSYIIHDTKVFDDVGRVVNILEKCAAEPTHTPALCQSHSS
ncbi:hypothetical protein T439DRAFT_110689 [Meredithblackwellia eburnea MCA 4105]